MPGTGAGEAAAHYVGNSLFGLVREDDLSMFSACVRGILDVPQGVEKGVERMLLPEYIQQGEEIVPAVYTEIGDGQYSVEIDSACLRNPKLIVGFLIDSDACYGEGTSEDKVKETGAKLRKDMEATRTEMAKYCREQLFSPSQVGYVIAADCHVIAIFDERYLAICEASSNWDTDNWGAAGGFTADLQRDHTCCNCYNRLNVIIYDLKEYQGSAEYLLDNNLYLFDSPDTWEVTSNMPGGMRSCSMDYTEVTGLVQVHMDMLRNSRHEQQV